jgi:hypothetical protein
MKETTVMTKCKSMTITRLITLICGLTFSTAAQSQNRCSTTMARGTYAVECQGDATTGQGNEAIFLPATALGTVVLDGEGSVSSGSLNVNIGGLLSIQEVTGGSGIVNTDCSSSVTLTIGDVGSADLTGILLDQGAKILTSSPFPGTSALCTLTRISLD